MSGQTTGLTLSFISRSTGLGKSKIKMIQSRHPELQELPYSTRAGGARVYFQAFIEYLAKYEGAEAAEKISHESHNPVTFVTRVPKDPQGGTSGTPLPPSVEVVLSAAFLTKLDKMLGSVEAKNFLFHVCGYSAPMGAGRAALGLPAPKTAPASVPVAPAKRLLSREEGDAALAMAARLIYTPADLYDLLGFGEPHLTEALRLIEMKPKATYTAREAARLWGVYQTACAKALRQAEEWREAHPSAGAQSSGSQS